VLPAKKVREGYCVAGHSVRQGFIKGGHEMTRTYEIKETRRAKIVGGINGAKRRWATAFDVYETTNGRAVLVLNTFNPEFAEKRLAYLRENLS
jgi:hypothetical protein